MEANIPKLRFYRCQLSNGEMGYKLNPQSLARDSVPLSVPAVLEEDEVDEFMEIAGKEGVAVILESFRDDSGKLTEPDEELLTQERNEDY